MRFWNRFRSLISDWLVLGGLGLIGYAVVYWWKGFPFPVVMLATYAAFGCLALGVGTALRPATARALTISTVSFALSSALLLGLFLVPPWPTPVLALFALSCAGAAQGYLRLRRRRRK